MCLQRWLRPPGDLPVMKRFTTEQQAAIEARSGSSLLAANAPSGRALREPALGVSAPRRPRGPPAPRLTIPPPSPTPDPTTLAPACAAAQRDLAPAGDGMRVAAARPALEACAALVAAPAASAG